MAVDNPSYFSLSSSATTTIAASSSGTTTPVPPPSVGSTPSVVKGHGLSALFRRRTPCKMGAASSSTPSSLAMHRDGNRGVPTPSTPTDERVPMLPKNGATTPHSTNGVVNQRRSFRNLFRSVSANADHEKTQQFLKGDPRPSDVAPPSPYLPHRSHSHSENDRRRPGRGRRVLKSASELLSNDMVYCGLSGSKHRADDDDDEDEDDDDDDTEPTEEVFLGVDDARYYNLSSTLPMAGSAAAGRRRHSIGTFLGKDQNTGASSLGRRGTHDARTPIEHVDVDASSSSALVDTVDGGSVRVDEKTERSSCRSRRRRHRSSSSKGSRSNNNLNKLEGNNEDDVVFVSSKESEAASLWVNYLTACFEQISRQQGRPPFKVRHVTLEESLSPGTEERIRSSRLRIIVVCPVLLERVSSGPEHATSLSKHFAADGTLAMMLGVHEGNITESQRSRLASYDRWKKFFVKDQDETFVGEFLGAAVSILGTAPPAALRNDKTAFSVHPKKVKLGHNRVIALLNDPLRPEDDVTVIVDRCGEAIEIGHFKRRNPYALQFSIPERCLEVSMLVGIRISRNGQPLGVRQVKCESRLRELDQILRAHDNPLEFVCQTFGFNPGDREQLDNWMVHAFQRNVPPHFNLLSTPNGITPAHKNHTSSEENPTLLHFAARFGLERLAWQLLECPGGDLACDLRNVSELTPADLAEQAGHSRLAHQLRGYMQMNEFTNMYSYLKGISENSAESAAGTDHSSNITMNDNDKEDYCRPRPLSEAYSVPPAARPVTTLILPVQSATTANSPMEANYSIVPTPTPVHITPPTTSVANVNGLDLPLLGYMKMQPAGPRTPTSNIASQQPSRTGTPTSMSRHDSHSTISSPKEENNVQASCAYNRAPSNSSTKSREPSGPQDELLEIINDFKNNVFSISEVEKLVENWRNRNDVQQSFKDKQRQLTAMREEYERIQKKMKEEMKAPTPFDKIRKFFSKGKKESKDSSNSHEDPSSSSKTEAVNGTLADRRPVSSLSLRSISSSSSSGRMSTASGCSGTSLGDSGTHSDPEDRRLQNAREDKSTGVMSYEIPPAPKPFTGRYSPALRYSPSPRSSTGNDLDLRHQPSRTEDSEYYIAFPPSGLPVHSFKSDGSLREPKTPNSPCENPRYLELQDATTEPQKDIEATKHPSTGYANIDPSVSSLNPLPPPGMCIPTNYVNITPCNVSTNENSSPRSSKVEETRKIVLNTQAQEKEDNRAQTAVENHSNGTRGVDVPDTSKVPEYMNVNPGQEIAKVVGVLPKKLPAPPIPPRGAIL